MIDGVEKAFAGRRRWCTSTQRRGRNRVPQRGVLYVRHVSRLLSRRVDLRMTSVWFSGFDLALVGSENVLVAPGHR